MYGNYSSPGGPGVAVAPEVQQWFSAVDRDRSGKINCQELQAALVNGQGRNFSEKACRLMIAMFDTNNDGTIDVNEFQMLYNYINQWLATFRSYDRDQSGMIDENEFGQAFTQMGFRFSPQFISFLVSKSENADQKQISVDEFIVVCVQVQRLTESFRQRDTSQTGVISIDFEDFLQVALNCAL